MQNIKKRHHTVPKCYLQNFTDKNRHLWVFDKNKIFHVSPEKILVEKDFYTIILKDGKKNLLVENTLANIESDYIDIFIDKISCDKFLTSEERAKISIFIATLLLRTKPYRERLRRTFHNIKDVMEKWKKQFDNSVAARELLSTTNSGEGISLKDINKYLDNFEEQHSISIIENPQSIAQIIFNMKWSILISKNDDFLTSDNPLVLLRPASIKKYGFNAMGSRPGLMYKDVELTLPLSKNRLLLAGWILEKDSYLYIKDDVIQNVNARTVMHYSERIIASSKEKIENEIKKFEIEK